MSEKAIYLALMAWWLLLYAVAIATDNETHQIVTTIVWVGAMICYAITRSGERR